MIKFNKVHNTEGADRMGIIDNASELLNDENVKNAAFDLFADSIEALSGSLFAVAKILFFAIHSPFALRDKIFWIKFKKFLDGVFTTEEQRARFAAKLASDGNKNDNAMRLLLCIEKSDAEKKIDYLINASRSLCADFITLEQYFRICHIISQSVLEDLKFAADNLSDNAFTYSLQIQGLLATGLVMQSTYSFEENGVQEYKFTPLAKMIDCFALSYGNVNRYPNPKGFELSSVPALNSKTAEKVANLQEMVEKQPTQRLLSSKEAATPTENGAINWIYG